MTWVRPRTPSDWIKLPSYIYIKYLSTFRCSGWPYGFLLSPSKPWMWVDLVTCFDPSWISLCHLSFGHFFCYKPTPRRLVPIFYGIYGWLALKHKKPKITATKKKLLSYFAEKLFFRSVRSRTPRPKYVGSTIHT